MPNDDRRPAHLVRVTLGVLAGAAAVRACWLIARYFDGGASVRRHHIESTLFVLAALLGGYLVASIPAFRDQPAQSTPSRPVRLRVAWAAAMLLAFAVFGRALRIGFLSDDFVLANWARSGELVGAAHEFVRPFPLLLWRLLLLAGSGPRMIHALSLGLHGTNVILAALVARDLGASRLAAAGAAGIFLLWPTQAEPVMWAAGIFDVVMTSSVLAFVVVYARWADAPSRARALTLLGLAIAALASKETAVALPFLAALARFPRWTVSKPQRRELVALGLLALGCAAYLAWRVVVRDPVGGDLRPTLTTYTVKELVSRTYASLSVPLTGTWIAQAPAAAAALALLVVIVSVTAVLLVRSRRDAATAVAAVVWPIACTAPAIGFLVVGSELENSRYLYLAVAGWGTFLAWSCERCSTAGRGATPVVLGCAGATLLIMALALNDRIVAWQMAADARESVLRKARYAMRQNECGTARFEKAPVTLGGAQLLRNGLDIAMAAEAHRRTARDCVFSWNGGQWQLAGWR